MNEGTAYTTIIVALALALIAQVMMARFWKRRAKRAERDRDIAKRLFDAAMLQVNRAQKAIENHNDKLATVNEWPETIGEK